MNEGVLAGRVALVTGGGSGIGRATALLLAERGAGVAVADIDELGARVTEELVARATGATAAGRPVVALRVDVTSPDEVDAMVAGVAERFGRLDLAVNAAGVSGRYGATAEMPVEEWQRVIDVNLTGVFLCLRAELRHMLTGHDDGGGEPVEGRAIVNVASAAGQMGVPGLAHYSASKHGVIGLTRSAALECARRGLRINAVLPGTVRTPMLQRFAGGDEAVDRMGAASPVGRVAEPDEIASAIAWLCSPEASYVTGHAFAVDGGALAT